MHNQRQNPRWHLSCHFSLAWLLECCSYQASWFTDSRSHSVKPTSLPTVKSKSGEVGRKNTNMNEEKATGGLAVLLETRARRLEGLQCFGLPPSPTKASRATGKGAWEWHLPTRCRRGMHSRWRIASLHHMSLPRIWDPQWTIPPPWGARLVQTWDRMVSGAVELPFTWNQAGSILSELLGGGQDCYRSTWFLVLETSLKLLFGKCLQSVL